MMCTTVLQGGVCNRTSTPHKSGIKMKEKKKSLVAKSTIRTPTNDYYYYYIFRVALPKQNRYTVAVLYAFMICLGCILPFSIFIIIIWQNVADN